MSPLCVISSKWAQLSLQTYGMVLLLGRACRETTAMLGLLAVLWFLSVWLLEGNYTTSLLLFVFFNKSFFPPRELELDDIQGPFQAKLCYDYRQQIFKEPIKEVV